MSAREALWAAGTPARGVAIGAIRLYRVMLSGVLGGQCRFEPSCSHYGEEAVRTHGIVRGSALTAWRILRCQPFSRGGVDHVPPRTDGGVRRQQYDTVTHAGGSA